MAIECGDIIAMRLATGGMVVGKLQAIIEGTCQFQNVETEVDEIIPLWRIERITKSYNHPAIKKKLARDD